MMFQPFKIGTESIDIDDLTLENGLDVVNMYGQVQFHQDVISLNKAKQLHQLLHHVIEHLEQQQQLGTLPEKVEFLPSKMVNNPFLSDD